MILATNTVFVVDSVVVPLVTVALTVALKLLVCVVAGTVVRADVTTAVVVVIVEVKDTGDASRLHAELKMLAENVDRSDGVLIDELVPLEV